MRMSWIFFGLVLSGCAARHSPATSPTDNVELATMLREDQADRRPKDLDWSVVKPRDEARRTRTLELLETGAVVTGADFYGAALILQHGDTADDALLAHELCVIAVSKGAGAEALWLAAASEDRFLDRIGRKQRFATQYKKDSDGSWRLTPVDPGVTDEMRRAMNTPRLIDAKATEDRLNHVP